MHVSSNIRVAALLLALIGCSVHAEDKVRHLSYPRYGIETDLPGFVNSADGKFEGNTVKQLFGLYLMRDGEIAVACSIQLLPALSSAELRRKFQRDKLNDCRTYRVKNPDQSDTEFVFADFEHRDGANAGVGYRSRMMVRIGTDYDVGVSCIVPSSDYAAQKGRIQRVLDSFKNPPAKENVAAESGFYRDEQYDVLVKLPAFEITGPGREMIAFDFSGDDAARDSCGFLLMQDLKLPPIETWKDEAIEEGATVTNCIQEPNHTFLRWCSNNLKCVAFRECRVRPPYQLRITIVAPLSPDSKTATKEDEIQAFLKSIQFSPKAKKPDEQLRQATEAIRQADSDPVLYMQRAHIYIDREMFPDAIRDLNQVVRLSPKKPWGYMFRAMAHARSGNDQAAVDDFDTAIQLGPPNSLVYIGRARVLTSLDRLDEALRDCNRAIQADDDRALYYAQRAEVRRRTGDEAYLDDLQKFVELAPDHPFSERIRAANERPEAIRKEQARREVDSLLQEAAGLMRQADLTLLPEVRFYPEDRYENADLIEQVMHQGKVQDSINNARLAADRRLDKAREIAERYLPQGDSRRAEVAELRKKLDSDMKGPDWVPSNPVPVY